MSFDVFLQTHNDTGEFQETANPFTGEMMRVPIDRGVSEEERAAIQAVIGSVKHGGPDEVGCYVIECADGGSAELFADALSTSEPFARCMFAVRSEITPELARLIWEIANRGRMSVMAAMEDAPPIVTSEAHREMLPPDLDEAAVCESPEQLAEILNRGVATWQEYVDQLEEDED